MEGPLTMILHGSIIAFVLFFVMRYILGQSNNKALTRSVLLGCLSAVYMIMFGHRLPTRLNSNL